MAGFNFPGPASHFKLVLPAPGQHGIDLPEPDSDGLIMFDRAMPPIMRTYTARRFDRRTRELDIVTRGYWRAGAANHPDHDYGEDQLGA